MLRLQHLRRRLREPRDLELLGKLEDSLALAADRLRRLIFDFRPPKLSSEGLAAATRDLLDGLAEDHSLVVHLENRLRGRAGAAHRGCCSSGCCRRPSPTSPSTPTPTSAR